MIIDTEQIDSYLKAMTARELSEKTGINQRTIESWKSGRYSWLGKYAEQLAEAINILIEEKEEEEINMSIQQKFNKRKNANKLAFMGEFSRIDVYQDMDDPNNIFVEYDQSHQVPKDKIKNVYLADDEVQALKTYFKAYDGEEEYILDDTDGVKVVADNDTLEQFIVETLNLN
ncbi:hypothetical protein MFLO_04225 [Listeria floridensis FSL S10-1187]|uniref:HTH cro/C1-type domain-containing protein n=1 Tax=Listeria floridensis FSL S10-1187 TaxID=1265817 RepID=A0ABN0RGU4_9LIST|nr:helix-turn-helix transcriptional regulator [Listeria floridensis]EUJ33118.1 hypothetical protein MFLO_04225 [Listeria floridensis FSL S10-1187]